MSSGASRYDASVSRISVAIVDDEALVRTALTVFLSEAPDLHVVGEATNGAEAVELVAQLNPDVVVMDIQMPVMDGIKATRHIVNNQPSTKILAITTFGSFEVSVPMLQAGASGFLFKDTEPESIVAAVRNVHAGIGVLSPEVMRRLLVTITPDVPPLTVSTEETLTPRESAIVEMLAQGLSNGEIAAALFVSESTVKTHLGRVMEKWDVRDRLQVVLHAARTGQVLLR